MKLVIGGAFQGKLDFAKKMTGKETGWADGAAVSKEELSACSGVYDFQELVRRWLLLEEETGTALEAELEELLQKNPEICIVTNELGYGVGSDRTLRPEMAGKDGAHLYGAGSKG